MICNSEHYQPLIHDSKGICVTWSSRLTTWLHKPVHFHQTLACLVHTVGVRLTFLIGVLAVLFIQSTSVMTTFLNEIMDLDYSHTEISIIPPANTTPAIISSAANTVAPPLTLHTDAGGCLFPTKFLSPRTYSPLRPLILECELAHHPDKALVQQLIFNPAMVVPLDIINLNLQLMPGTLVQHYSIPPSSTNILQKG